jgi:hypothetical protein
LFVYFREKKQGFHDVLHVLADSLRSQTNYDNEMKRADKKGQTPIDYSLTGEHKNDTVKKYLTYAACTQIEMLTAAQMRATWRKEFALAVAMTLWIPYMIYSWFEAGVFIVAFV